VKFPIPPRAPSALLVGGTWYSQSAPILVRGIQSNCNVHLIVSTIGNFGHVYVATEGDVAVFGLFNQAELAGGRGSSPPGPGSRRSLDALISPSLILRFLLLQPGIS